MSPSKGVWSDIAKGLPLKKIDKNQATNIAFDLIAICGATAFSIATENKIIGAVVFTAVVLFSLLCVFRMCDR